MLNCIPNFSCNTIVKEENHYALNNHNILLMLNYMKEKIPNKTV